MTRFKAVLLGALLTTLVSTGLGRVCRAGETPREVAAAHYARGVELASQGAYEAALEQFNSAYTISPHFAVLYNIGQAQIALGRRAEASAALSQYLRDGAAQIPLGRREQVEAQLSMLGGRSAEPKTAPAGPDGNLPPPLSPPAAPPPREPAAEASPPRAPVGERPAPELPGPTKRRVSYALAGAGLLAAGGALGVYLWNRDRYAEWQRGDALLQDQTLGPTLQRRQIAANNELAATLTSANHAILGLGVAAGALVAAGATLFLLDRHERHGAGKLAFGWGGDANAWVAWSGRW